MTSPFEILQIDRDADEEEIKRAYRRRMKETHPDQGGSAKAFTAVREAYEAVVSGDYGDASETAVETGASTAQSDPEPVDPEVTYLNYEVLEDHGWDIDDDTLFAKAADAGLTEVDYGSFRVEPGESLLEAAERRGYAWPYACRGGACANCAVVIRKGDLSTPVDHILPDEMVERGIQLSCNAVPLADELHIVYNVKHMPELEELLLPPRPFENAHADD